MGLGQACRRKAKSSEQLGAKSLDRALGGVHTWPHSHYLMRQCNGVGGWVQLKYRLCRCRCGWEMCRYKKLRNVRVQNQQSDEGRDWCLHPLIFSMAPGSPTPLLSWSPYSPDPLTLLTPYPTLLSARVPASPKLPATSDPCFWNWMHIRNCVGCASVAELQSHRRLPARSSVWDSQTRKIPKV